MRLFATSFFRLIITARKRSCGKVTGVCVCDSVQGGGGVPGPGGAWWNAFLFWELLAVGMMFVYKRPSFISLYLHLITVPFLWTRPM